MGPRPSQHLKEAVFIGIRHVDVCANPEEETFLGRIMLHFKARRQAACLKAYKDFQSSINQSRNFYCATIIMPMASAGATYLRTYIPAYLRTMASADGATNPN